MSKTSSEIKFTIELDQNKVPETLSWTAKDGGVENEESKAIMLSIWDNVNKETLRIDFSDGNSYEYFGVPKGVYVKLLNAPSQARFLRRHIAGSFTYRSINRLVAA